MKPGASALFDSGTPHAYLSGSSAGTKIRIVVNRGFAAPVQAPGDLPIP